MTKEIAGFHHAKGVTGFRKVTKINATQFPQMWHATQIGELNQLLNKNI